jgi:hypothetical protein
MPNLSWDLESKEGPTVYVHDDFFSRHGEARVRDLHLITERGLTRWSGARFMVEGSQEEIMTIDRTLIPSTISIMGKPCFRCGLTGEGDHILIDMEDRTMATLYLGRKLMENWPTAKMRLQNWVDDTEHWLGVLALVYCMMYNLPRDMGNLS